MRTLQTNEITKTYRGRKVVDNVSIWVKQGEVVGLQFVIELGFLKGREKLPDLDVHSLVQYD